MLIYIISEKSLEKLGELSWTCGLIEWIAETFDTMINTFDILKERIRNEESFTYKYNKTVSNQSSHLHGSGFFS